MLKRRRNYNLIKIASAALCLIIAFTAATFGWFSRYNTIDFPNAYGGTAKAAYFAGGDGSKNDPYKIKTAVHLYNFAWLQYLGYFNLNPTLNNGRAQSYFELADNVDMSILKSALPPVGTSQYPFIGGFNGANYRIYNLTVSNQKSDLTVRPLNAHIADNSATNAGRLLAATQNGEVSVVGLFGVVGDYNAFLADNYIGKSVAGAEIVINDSSTDFPADLSQIALNEFYHKGMYVKNFYVDKVHVKSYSKKTLLGLAAGYVNATMQNVGVYRSDASFTAGATGLTDDYGAVVSKYSLIGDYNKNAVSWNEDPTAGSTGGGDGGWGGSIDSRILARRINYMMSSAGEGNILPSFSSSAYSNYGFFKNENFNFYGAMYATGVTNSSSHGYMFKYGGVAGNSITVSLLGAKYYTGGGVDSSGTEKELYTYLPLNIDLKTMGLKKLENQVWVDDESETTTDGYVYKYAAPRINNVRQYKVFDKTGNALNQTAYAWNVNTNYQIATSEALLDKADLGSNTGYIVGQSGTSLSSAQTNIVQVNIRPLSYSGKGGSIQKAFGQTDANGLTFSSSNLGLLTYYYDEANTENSGFRVIKDDVNKGNVGADNKLHGKTVIDASEHYNDIRADFDYFLGKNGTIYGLLFDARGHIKNNAGQTTAKILERTVNLYGETVENYKLVSGAINFNVKKPGIITAIVGTYNNVTSSVKNNALTLYTVNREELSIENGKINGVQEVETIYYNAETKTDEINPSQTAGKKLKYDKKWYNAENAQDSPLENNAAFYIEIPVPAGDYLIGTNGQNNGYFMYLDIGANGDDGGDEPSPGTGKDYYMSSVDFVNTPSVTPDANGAYPAFKDVTVALSGVSETESAQTIYMRNNDGLTDSAGQIADTLRYKYKNITAVVSPSGLGDDKSDDDTFVLSTDAD